MSEDNLNYNDEFLQYTDNRNEEKNITIKKSTYNNLRKGMIAAIAIITFLGGYAIGTLDDTSNSYVTNEDLKEIISEIETKAAAAPATQPAQIPTQPTAPQVFRVSLDDDPVKGNPDAPVTVVEFSDFQCPFCSRFFQQTLPLIEENYIDTGKIKFVYKDLPLDSLHPNARAAHSAAMCAALPLDSLHPNARAAHIAAECADEQGKFWEYHDVLFEKQPQWSNLASSKLQNKFTKFATDMGLQAASFESCMQSPNIADEVNKDVLEAVSYGATGTPTFFIGSEEDGFVKLVGAQPYQTFQAVIDSRLG